jgi:hypothetical protein
LEKKLKDIELRDKEMKEEIEHKKAFRDMKRREKLMRV